MAFCKSVVANVFFNNKRKLSTDCAVVTGVKAFKKDREKCRLEIFITPNCYFIF